MRMVMKWSMAVLLSWSAVAWGQTVDAFSPTGTVKEVRQVTARFATQMVAFGDMRTGDPFTVDCPEKGKGRWIDGSNWSYDFERDLPGGVRCRFTLIDASHDLAGAALTGERVFVFDTGGPAVVDMLPREGSRIDERQIFLLALDAPAREATVAAHLWCQAAGINEKIPARLLAGSEREAILALRRDFVDRYLQVYFKRRGVLWRANVPIKARKNEGLPVLVAQCQRSLPAGAEATLVWGAGIVSESGIATSEEQRLQFQTRPDFSARFSCERMQAKGDCIPFLPTRLGFTAPVAVNDARAIALVGANGKRYPAIVAKDAGEFVDAVTFPAPLPEQSSFKIQLPPALRDDAGRALVNQARFPMTVRTVQQPPLVKFAAPFGIIEAKGDRLLPVTVRNVEARLAGTTQTVGGALRVGDSDQEVIAWMKKFALGGGWHPQEPGWGNLTRSLLPKDDKLVQRFALPRRRGSRAFEVIGIPLRTNGLHLVELASPRLGAAINGHGGTAYVRTTALVTNMSAHFKHGASSSLVWVTSLDKGKPVPKAKVAVRNCDGVLLWEGVTDANGVASIGVELTEGKCRNPQALFISARSGQDFTFTLSDWKDGIEPWRFNLDTRERGADSRMVATVFDRTLLRAGETVHMKHFLRRHVASGMALVTGEARPDKAFLIHQGSDERVSLPLHWDSAGNASSDWPIPAEAKLGTYEVMIDGQSAGSFRVEQFRVPTMKAVLKGPATASVAPQQVSFDAQVSYLSGGPAGLAPVKLRTALEERTVSVEGWDGFSFNAEEVKEGLNKEGGAFDDEEGEWAGEDGEGAVKGAVRTQALVLDAAGGARIVVDKLPQVQKPQTLTAELSYQDANGETFTVSQHVPIWPAQYLVGIKPDSWLMNTKGVKFQVAVIDVDGKPVAGAEVAVDVFERSWYSHRRRLVGGFYAYENGREVKKVGDALCSGRTDAKGLLFCQITPPNGGNLVLRARTSDPQQRLVTATHDLWAAGSGERWFGATDSDRIDLLPSKNRYEPGEDASFQVRMPFREATMLVTIEREGILDTYVRTISSADPVLTVPMKPSYAPNVFVSALLVRGRVAGPAPTAMVDLGKPAYKLGIVPVRVGWAAHELKVQVSADREVYKVREKATVKVKVATAQGAVAAGAEVALAAVDTGLLELMPNTSWNLLETMMRERGLQVETSTAQMQVVGKRHFGRKAFPHGGGGGRSGGRELFDTLLFWQSKVVLDANGEATVQVPLNDSLTGFRIVAIASSGAGYFGTGQADIRSTQDLMLLSGLPPVAREGDRLRAGFTVRNTTNAPLQVTLSATVAAGDGKAQSLPAQTVTLAAGEAREQGWDYQVPVAASLLRWEIAAVADGASDRIKVSQKVKPAVPVTTMQATLLQLDGPKSMTVKRPDDALPGRGGIQTLFSARLAGEMPAVRSYMTEYPYTCFEQETSRAVSLRDPAKWKALMARLPAFMDSDGLLKYFPMMERGSDSLTAYVLSVASEAGYPIPQNTKGTLRAALTGFVEGRIVRYSALATTDLAVRKIAALEALSRDEPVRAELTQSFTIAPNLWPTSAVIDWYLILLRSPALPERAVRLAEAEKVVRARLNLQGTTMGFSTERSDDWWWLMASGDVNANRLLLAMLDNASWQGDMGRLARGALGRQMKGRWGTTVANAWGVLAMEKFSQKFESQPVVGSSSASLGGVTRTQTLGLDKLTGSALLPWPNGAETLKLAHTGSGKPWATVQSLAAVPLKAPLSSGYRIARTVTPIEQKTPGVWSRGDIYRVHLDLEAQSDMTWVVVDDPIPASATILGTGLGGDSQLLASGEKSRGFVYPAFEERTQEAFHAYYEWVPKGKWSVEYTVRLNNAGRFTLPPTRVEAMYSPEMFGAAPNAEVKVGP